MGNLRRMLVLSVIAVFILTGNALALGINITIWDKRGEGATESGGGEDGETEPGMINTQAWDLEGFFLDGTTLTMVGGFDFKDGYEGYDSGDIFIDIDGNAQYGIESPDPSVSNYGYDYVLDLDFISRTYDVYRLNTSSNLASVIEALNQPESNPWRHIGGDSVISGWSGRTMVYTDFGILTDGNTGFSGNSHNAVGVDLGFLPAGTEFTSHFTIECGNDNLMGQGTMPVPEPGTAILFVCGLIGLSWFRRRFKK